MLDYLGRAMSKSLLQRIEERQARKRITEYHIKGTISHQLISDFIGPRYVVTSTSGFQRAEAILNNPDDKPTERIIFHMEDSIDGSGAGVRLIGAMRSHVKAQLAAGKVRKVEPEDDEIRASSCGNLGADPVDCFELDITAAWFTSAREIRAVTKKFYNFVMRTTTKTQRLRMVGALATRRVVQEYLAGEPVGKRVIEYSCPETAPVLGWIRAHTDNAMRFLMRGARRDFLMYFADAIFIRKNRATAARLRKLASRRGFKLRGADKVYKLAPAPFQGGRMVPTITRKGEGDRPFVMG